jgi:hypothetical protein
MAEYIYGIASVKYGTVEPCTTVPLMPAATGMTQWAYTVKGSLTISEDESTTTEFFVEETTTAVHSIVTDAGQLKVTWRAYDITPALVAVMKGGTASGNGVYNYYYGPDTVDAQELALEVTTTDGSVFSIPKASCLGRFDSVVGRENLLEMEVVATALDPGSTVEKWPYRIRTTV